MKEFISASSMAKPMMVAKSKGMASKAKLNFGDCASFAIAKQRSLALLYKGDDFAVTDIGACI